MVIKLTSAKGHPWRPAGNLETFWR